MEESGGAIQHGAIIVHHNETDSEEDDGSEHQKEETTHEATGFTWFIHAVQDPTITKRRNTFVVALALFLIGVILIPVGIDGAVNKDSALHENGYISALVVGIICLIPGGYYMYVFIRVLRKVPGFTLEEVPGYE